MLTEKINLLINDDSLRRSIGKFNKIDVQKRFSWKISAQKYKEIYTEILDK